MASTDPGVRILVADPHALFREAVRAVLDIEDDLTVVGEASDGVQAVAEAARTNPDVVLLDANLPNRDGIKATEAIKEHAPDCAVIVLSDGDDQEMLADAVEAGATGFLTKECPLGELIDAARAVNRGETIIPGRMLGTLLGRLIHRRREQEVAQRALGRLTPREREVLALLTDGSDNDAIAQALVISPQTARTHIQNILSKLDVHSRLEAAAFVINNGVLDELERATG